MCDNENNPSILRKIEGYNEANCEWLCKGGDVYDLEFVLFVVLGIYIL